MAKRLCKYNRGDIADSLGAIHRLVVQPKYLCRSCARSSADKESLCKPAAIPPEACQNSATKSNRCALLEESTSLPPVALNHAEPHEDQNLKSTKASLKQAKKAFKKQKKYQKKLTKVLKQQKRLHKKRLKIEKQFVVFDSPQELDMASLTDHKQVH